MRAPDIGEARSPENMSDHQVPLSKEGFLPRLLGTCWAILRQRCPRCRQGKMFRGSFAMNDPCPRCGLLFQREEGYFLGAMYMSYPITSAILIPIYFALSALLPTWHSLAIVPLATALYLPFAPAVFRYARVLWIYFDRLGDPYDPSFLTSYEKSRIDGFTESAAKLPLGKVDE